MTMQVDVNPTINERRWRFLSAIGNSTSGTVGRVFVDNQAAVIDKSYSGYDNIRKPTDLETDTEVSPTIICDLEPAQQDYQLVVLRLPANPLKVRSSFLESTDGSFLSGVTGLYGIHNVIDVYRQVPGQMSGPYLRLLDSEPRTNVFEFLRRSFYDAQQEEFELGIESDFSRALKRAFIAYGAATADAIQRLLSERVASEDVSVECLIQLGLIEQASTQRDRLEILLQYLEDSSPDLRQASLLGLGSMNDPEAIPALAVFQESESVPLLQELARQVTLKLQRKMANGAATGRSR